MNENDTTQTHTDSAEPVLTDTLLEKITFSNSIITILIIIIVVMIIFPGNTAEDTEDITGQLTDNDSALPMTIASEQLQNLPAPVLTASDMPMTMPETDLATTAAEDEDAIERKNEGRLFYRTIKIPANAETLYVSGSGANPKEDGSWGNMEEQAIDTFSKFRETLAAEGWSMSDIVQVRAFAVAGEYGLLDFDGFNRGYSRFFGTEENPNKPVRSFVQVADLVREGWLVEVEIRAARVL